MRPPISILIATRARAELLSRAIESLASQEIGARNFEVVICNNGNDEATSRVIAAAEQKLRVTVVEESRPGKNRALNKGLGLVRGEIIVFTDDDIRADPGWLMNLWACSRRWSDVGVFGGRIVPELPEIASLWMTAPDFRYAGISFGQYHPREDEGPTAVLPFGANYAVRRELMANRRFAENIGPAGSNYAMGSETELLERLKGEGVECVYVPSAIVHHHVAPAQVTGPWFRSRAFRSGRGRARIEPCLDAPQFFGAPRYLWKQLAAANLRRLASIFKGEQQRTTAAMDEARIRGQIYEYRLMGREQRLSQAASMTREAQAGAAP